MEPWFSLAGIIISPLLTVGIFSATSARKRLDEKIKLAEQLARIETKLDSLPCISGRGCTHEH
jgi:hypothetical protein